MDYWWVWTIHQGRLIVFSPPYSTEDEAGTYGFQKMGGGYEVSVLKTRDSAEATRAIKRRIFDRTRNLDGALKRAKHEKETGGLETDS